MIRGRDRDETIRLTADAYGISEVDAAEIVDIEDGRSDGDIRRRGESPPKSDPPNYGGPSDVRRGTPITG
jgi:hypothetical protein